MKYVAILQSADGLKSRKKLANPIPHIVHHILSPCVPISETSLDIGYGITKRTYALARQKQGKLDTIYLFYYEEVPIPGFTHEFEGELK